MSVLLRRLLVRPRPVLADRPTALAGPVKVVFILGVVAVGGTLVPALVLIGNRMPSLLPESPAVSLATGSGAVSVPSFTLQIMALSLLSPFFFWILTALLVHGLIALGTLANAVRNGRPVAPAGYPTRSSLAARVNAFRGTLVAVGWGYTPQILASLVTASVTIPLSLADPAGLPEAILFTPAGHTVLRVPETPTLTLLTHTVGAASVLWSGHLWVEGLQSTRGLSRRTALLAVVPVAILLLVVSDAVGFLGLVG